MTCEGSRTHLPNPREEIYNICYFKIIKGCIDLFFFVGLIGEPKKDNRSSREVKGVGRQHLNSTTNNKNAINLKQYFQQYTLSL